MGYYATASGYLVIEDSNIRSLSLTVRLMLNETDKMSGGSWTGGKETGKWYAWVDSKVLAECCKEKDLPLIFECWGFGVSKQDSRYNLTFDSKTGDEEYFLKKIAPYVKEGEIIWKGEDGEMWKHKFREGVLQTLNAKISWV